MRTPRSSVLLCGLVGVLLLPACGDDDASASTEPPATTATPVTVPPTTTVAVSTAAPTTLAPATVAPTATTAPPTGRQVTFTWEFAPSMPSAPVCDGAMCAYPVSSTSETASLFRGRWVAVGAGAPRPGGGYSGLSFRLFSGEVDGCGTGTAMIEESIATDDGVALRGEWRIVAGGGTDALAGLAGAGTFVGTQGPDGSGQVEGTGTLDC